jgi:mono/diheme cytochrome c family protein
MAIRPRTWVVGALLVVVVLVLGLITKIGWAIVLGPAARPVTSRKFERTDARMARGEYLVEAGAHCFHCHSDHDMSNPEAPVIQAKKGAGWELPIPELGTITAPNITPDKDTGIGSWSDDEIARAVQEGIDKDGKALFPVMPYDSFRNLDEEDLASIIVYLRSIPPVRNTVPQRKLIFPLNFIVNTIPKPLTAHAAPAPRTTAVARGEYLVKAVAGCDTCHTPTDAQGLPLPGLAYSGGAVFHDPSQHGKEIFSANITKDPSGLEHYDEAMFLETIRAGQMRGRTLSHIMPFEMFKRLTDDDLKDIWAFLREQTPVKHRVSNIDPPTKCPVCGQTHGLGELNVAR